MKLGEIFVEIKVDINIDEPKEKKAAAKISESMSNPGSIKRDVSEICGVSESHLEITKKVAENLEKELRRQANHISNINI